MPTATVRIKTGYAASLKTIRQSPIGPYSATLDITSVTNNLGSDAQLVCWVDWDGGGIFSGISGNNGTGNLNERSYPELIANTLTRIVGGSPAVDHYASVVTSSTAVITASDHYALAVTADQDADDETFALGTPNGSVAILDKEGRFNIGHGK